MAAIALYTGAPVCLECQRLQKFASVHANAHYHFNQQCSLVDLQTYKHCHSAVLAEWQCLMG